jgi:hypothetical protein
MLEAFLKLIVEQFANVFDRGIFEKIVPGPVVVMSKDIPDDLFEVSEVHDHAVFRLAGDGDLDFIGVSVQGAALRMAGEKVRAIDVFGHTNPHGVRIAYEKVEDFLSGRSGRPLKLFKL